MARIRTIKPQFFTHDELSSLSAETHLFAAALLCQADDEGYFDANAKVLAGAIFPLRDTSVSAHDMLTELAVIGYVRLGATAQGRRYGRILKFAEHQRINRPTPSKISCLSIKWEAHCILTEDSLSPHRASSDRLTEHSHPEGKGREWNKEGNGTEWNRASANANAKRSDPESQSSEQEPDQEPDQELKASDDQGVDQDLERQEQFTETVKSPAHESTSRHSIFDIAPRQREDKLTAEENWPSTAPARDEAVQALLAAHPRKNMGHHVTQIVVSQIKKLAAERGKGEWEAYGYLLDRTKLYAAATAKWPAAERQFIKAAVNFFGDEEYRQDDSIWNRSGDAGGSDGSAILQRIAEGGGGRGIDTSTLPRAGSEEHRRLQEAARNRHRGLRPGFVGFRPIGSVAN